MTDITQTRIQWTAFDRWKKMSTSNYWYKHLNVWGRYINVLTRRLFRARCLVTGLCAKKSTKLSRINKTSWTRTSVILSNKQEQFLYVIFSTIRSLTRVIRRGALTVLINSNEINSIYRQGPKGVNYGSLLHAIAITLGRLGFGPTFVPLDRCLICISLPQFVSNSWPFVTSKFYILLHLLACNLERCFCGRKVDYNGFC